MNDSPPSVICLHKVFVTVHHIKHLIQRPVLPSVPSIQMWKSILHANAVNDS